MRVSVLATAALAMAALGASCSPAPTPPPGGWTAGGREGYGLSVRPAAGEDLTPRLIGRTPPRPLAPVEPGVEEFSPEMPLTQAPSPTLGEDWVIERPGWLQVSGEGEPARFVFEAPDGGPAEVGPIVVLPNAFLAEMEDIASETAGERALFRITAEVTHYRGEPYLFIQKAMWQRPADR